MAITLDALKETLDNVATLIQFQIKIMFNPEIGFIRNAHHCRVLFKIITDGLTGVMHLSFSKDFWEIPLLIKSLNPKYKLFIKKLAVAVTVENKELYCAEIEI